MKRAPYFYDALLEILIIWLCVSDIYQIAVFSDTFIPDPDIGYILIPGVSIQAGVDIPLKINAIRIRGNWIVPAIYCRAIQRQSLADRRIFCERNPVIDIKWSFRLNCFRIFLLFCWFFLLWSLSLLGLFRLSRLCLYWLWLFFCWNGSGFCLRRSLLIFFWWSLYFFSFSIRYRLLWTAGFRLYRFGFIGILCGFFKGIYINAWFLAYCLRRSCFLWTVLLAHPDNKVSKTATIISIRFIGRPPLISYLYCMNATYLFQMCHIFFSDSTVSLLRSGGSVRGENQNSTA